ncbi:MAG: class I SAM-dependent methyltransferase [Actinomycetia bacterium]|nr:class I SAM-dependent methyltransferase [Actinomycetes bacterium]MCH9702449.1 class I SAM-dependent methyltransferase [Actinomycetes bacterium]MCH9733353.1 class I SAM-dependent methyltransferase [Actinomycetes bacterium]
MVIDYNQSDTAEQYKKTKAIPVRSRIEAYSFLKRIGDVTGKKVLDVACGAGDYTRILRGAGADPVVGFDISAKMIGLARDQEAREPLGIEYSVADARETVPQQDFDIAVAAYLLVYARDRDELAKMCRGLACRVRPGGRFVSITTNPDLYSFGRVPDYRKYGFRITLADTAYDGAPIELTALLDNGPLVIENYYLPFEAYESALREAGFRDFVVHMPELSAAPEACDEGDYWDDYLNYPPAVIIECIRS